MNILAAFKPVKLFVFDVDGVLTDGTVLVLNNGEQARAMHVKDGYALQLAIKTGYQVLVISGGYSVSVVERLRKRGITEVFMDAKIKKDSTPAPPQGAVRPPIVNIVDTFALKFTVLYMKDSAASSYRISKKLETIFGTTIPALIKKQGLKTTGTFSYTHLTVYKRQYYQCYGYYGAICIYMWSF